MLLSRHELNAIVARFWLHRLRQRGMREELRQWPMLGEAWYLFLKAEHESHSVAVEAGVNIEDALARHEKADPRLALFRAILSGREEEAAFWEWQSLVARFHDACYEADCHASQVVQATLTPTHRTSNAHC